MLIEHLDFKSYKTKGTSLSTLCPWICMAEEGIAKLKGNALTCAYEFIAPDIASSSIAKINSISNMFNNGIIQLGENWTVQFELQREINNDYPGSSFENFTGYLIERQRELNFTYSGNHFKNRYFLIFTYFLPPQAETKIKNKLLKSNTGKEKDDTKTFKSELKFFKMQTTKIAKILSTIMYIQPLNSSELLSLFHTSVSLNWTKMVYPEETHIFIDNVVTDSDLENSMPLKLGDYYIPIVAISSFPSFTLPAMFDVINKAGCELRWSTRFSCYSKEEALKKVDMIEKRFHSARKSIGQLVMESTVHVESSRENTAAIAEEVDAQEAKVDLTMGTVGYGDYCSNLMVWDKDIEVAEQKAQEMAGLISACGFRTKIETVNCLQAFLSMMPGNIYANRRELFCSTGNLSHVIPISSIWAGLSENNFMKDICGQKHPHVICNTEFNIPFFLNLNVRDVGHTWISGRTGAGKSTLLALLEAQWLKYPKSQVIIFDKDRSARNLTMCCGGIYIEPGKDDITFQPLAHIDTLEEQSWACEFIEILLTEQKIEVNAAMRNSIHDAIVLLATKDIKSRTLTTFSQYCNYLNPKTNTNDIVDGITPYVLGGQYGSLFDSDFDNFNLSSWTMIEMGTLMDMAQGAVAPALDYLFLQCEKKFTGKPTLLVLDEAWTFFKNPIFAGKIVEWLKTLRKKNVFVVFATQEINDAVNSPIASTLVSQCVTKIFLADEEAQTEMNYETYKKFGLEPSEIKLLSEMVRKQDYFYKSSMGTRRFQLELDDLQLGILTCSLEEHELLDRIENEFGKNTGNELVCEILKAKNIDYKHLVEGE
ncbi:MAG: AAA family ATPase [Treponema sp.]|uniref:VirB4 family type IV secretion/conjugal transfer ATPase n=1 Tax=Treponema sp. TaxID=166 RepID=UPI00298D8797|nr:AAA family ATPase [Treponema sp.]MCQ2601095.1 AAA family ATPase [Treponema sp.]